MAVIAPYESAFSEPLLYNVNVGYEILWILLKFHYSSGQINWLSIFRFSDRVLNLCLSGSFQSNHIFHLICFSFISFSNRKQGDVQVLLGEKILVSFVDDSVSLFLPKFSL